MEELYVEGLATHGDPESCVDDLRGRGEALTGARAGRAIEPRNQGIGVPTSCLWRKATLHSALARAGCGPTGTAKSGLRYSCRQQPQSFENAAALARVVS